MYQVPMYQVHCIGYCDVQEIVSFPKDYHFIVTFSLRSSQDTDHFLRHLIGRWVAYKGRSRFQHNKLLRIFKRKISIKTKARNRLCIYVAYILSTHYLGSMSREVIVVIVIVIIMTTTTTTIAVFHLVQNSLEMGLIVI